MRLRLFFAMWAVIAVVVGLTVLVYDNIDIGGDGGDQIVSGVDGGSPDGSALPGEDDPVVSPPASEVTVEGTVTTVLIADAVLEPRQVATPLTISSERGFGNGGELTTVEVDGEASTIVWDGGRPFVLSSGGPLVLDPVNVALVPGGFQARLGGGNHAFTPGPYQLDTPVAVGTGGIATSRDSVRFDAVDGSLFEARGDASILLGPEAPRHFVGPGKVILGGTLVVKDADGEHTEEGLITEAVSPFDLVFTPDGSGGWTVQGVVDNASFPL